MDKVMDMSDLLRKVNVHGSDDGRKFICADRRDRIISALNNSGWEKIVDDGFLLIYNNRFDETCQNAVLVSCHIDSIFNEDDYFLDFDNSGNVKGTLDNTASIAILLKTMLDDKLPPNVFVTFTADEEQKERGASGTVKYLRKNLGRVWERLSLVVVLDVSNRNWDKDISVESLSVKSGSDGGALAFPDVDSFIEYIGDILGANDVSFGVVRKEDAIADESWRYAKSNVDVFSLSLPVSVNCVKDENCRKSICYNARVREHCIKGIATTKRQMEKLNEALVAICCAVVRR